jgi:outer membrane biosynthesis protein TonB
MIATLRRTAAPPTPARALVILVWAALAGCAKTPATPEPTPELTVDPAANAALSPAEQPVAPGDCVEARRRAAAKPDLTVDQLPVPVKQKPAPLTRLPASAFRKDGSADVKVDVLIDTLGKAVMSTFTVVSTSSPALSANVKSVIGKWTFSPAQLAGCKVARTYHFSASAPARKKA